MKSIIVYLVKIFPGKFGVYLRKKCYAKFFGHSNFHIGENVTLGFKVGNITGGERLLVSPDTKIFTNTGKIFFGKNIFINFGCFISADRSRIDIGDNTIIGPGVTIWGSNHRYKDKNVIVREQGYDCKRVIIGNDVWIGANVTILPGAKIGEGVVVGAGSVVTGKEILPYSIVAGIPARRIAERT